MRTYSLALVNADSWSKETPAKIIEVAARSLTAALASVMDQADMVMEADEYHSILNDM